MKKFLFVLLVILNLFQHLQLNAQNRTIDSLKLALKNAKHDTTRVSILLYESDFFSRSNPDTVIPIINRALSIIDKNIDKANETEKRSYLISKAIAFNNLGGIFSNRGDIAPALDYFNKSLKIFEDFNNLQGLSSVIGEIGIINYYNGNISEAIKYFERGIKIKEEIQDKKGLAEALNNLGFVYNSLGNNQKTLEYYDKSLKVFEEIGYKHGVAMVLNNLGSIFDNQGDLSGALKYYSRSLKIREEAQDKDGIASSLNNIGEVYREQKDFSKALIYYGKSLNLFEEVGNKRGTATLLSNIGLCYQKQDDLQNALNYYFKSLKIHKEIGNKDGLVFSLNNIGATFFKLKKYKLALSYSDSSFVVAKEMNFIEGMRNALGIISEINSEIGNYTSAFKNYKQFIIYRDSLNNNETRKAGVKNQLKYEYEKRTASDSVRVQEEKKVISAQLQEEKTKSYALYGGLGIVLLFAGVMVNRFRVTDKQKKIIELKEQETQKQNLIITEQKHIVEEKHKEITDSINYAERIQRSFIATKEILDENLSSPNGGGGAGGDGGGYFVFFKPKDIVSGDFYWAAKLSSPVGGEPVPNSIRDAEGGGGLFALVTADSTGHGVPGAIMSLLNITSLEKAIETLTEPSEILNSTRKTIIERLKKDGSEHGGKDGMDASLCVFDFKNKKLIVAAANNPVWIIRNCHPERSEGSQSRDASLSLSMTEKEVIEIKPDKMPVGKHDKDTVSFTQQTIDLQSGDVVYTLTDGFPDQFGGEKGKKFMSKNLKELLSANSHLPMHEQKLLLEKTFAAWVGDLEQVDDVCLIGVRI